MKCSMIGPIARPGRNVERSDDHDHGDDQQTERRSDDGETAAVAGAGFFLASAPARARMGINLEIAADSMQNVCVQLNMVLA
jgi:hypothetical protein